MTNLYIAVNKVDSLLTYRDNPADYVEIDLINDYLIWSNGSIAVADGQDEPTELELTIAAPHIDPDDPMTVEKCFIFDDSEGPGTLREINGMGINRRYVFCFMFDGATASEPQLEAWDNSSHNTANFHVLGNGTPANSMIKGVATTLALPGEGWSGIPIADTNVLLLNDGAGALPVLDSTESAHDRYCNLKIVIPADYPTPAVEPFVLTVRYLYN